MPSALDWPVRQRLADTPSLAIMTVYKAIQRQAQGGAIRTMRQTANAALLAVLTGTLVLRCYLALVYEINWDEFLNLSMVHDFARGTLKEPLQTLFVRGFGWVSRISPNEVDQIIAARLVMLALTTGTVALIVWTARRFMPLHAALFAGLCFAAFSFGLRQGTTFRTDTMATTIVMASIAVLVRRPQSFGWAVAAGAAMGLAGMVTIKAVFHVPAVAGICLARLIPTGGRTRAFGLGVTVATAALLVFAGALLLHRAGLEVPASALSFLDRTTGRTLAESVSVFPRYWPAAVQENLVFTAALLAGTILTLGRLVVGHSWQTQLTVLSLLLPAASFAYYSESYPYFFPFVLAPASVLAGVALGALPAGAGQRVALAAALLICVQTILTGSKLAERDNHWQRQVLDVVHRMFPRPVAYIDHPSMVSSFPKVGFFMSGWGLADYYARGAPALPRPLIRDHQPRFILANQPMLSFQRLDPTRAGPRHGALLPADIEMLRGNFIPHWGPIAIAGKRIDLTDERRDRTFEIVIGGPHTVEAGGPVTIDGKIANPAEVVTLDPGPHTIESASPEVVTLRWGDNIYRPSEPAPEAPLFTGF